MLALFPKFRLFFSERRRRKNNKCPAVGNTLRKRRRKKSRTPVKVPTLFLPSRHFVCSPPFGTWFFSFCSFFSRGKEIKSCLKSFVLGRRWHLWDRDRGGRKEGRKNPHTSSFPIKIKWRKRQRLSLLPVHPFERRRPSVCCVKKNKNRLCSKGLRRDLRKFW